VVAKSRTENAAVEADTALLTTTQAATLLGVAVSTVQKLVEAGHLASWKTPGGHRRIAQAEVRKLLQNRSGQSGASLVEAPAHARADIDAEPARLAATRASGLLDTPAHASYDRIVRLASQVLDAPIALITLIDADRQWFKARFGMSMTHTPRSWAFCDVAIASDAMLVVEDALQDPRFAANPLVTGPEGVRFYAGVPLADPDGFRLGTLCVLDRRPRTLTRDQAWALTELAALAAEEMHRGCK
jgi:excisionase family DNA binding protein